MGSSTGMLRPVVVLSILAVAVAANAAFALKSVQKGTDPVGYLNAVVFGSGLSVHYLKEAL